MDNKLEKHIEKVEKQRAELMHTLTSLDKNLLNKQPSPNAWSVNQVLMHLMTSEALSMSYIQKKLSYSSNYPKTGGVATARMEMMRFVLWTNVKIKAPKFIDIPYQEFDFVQLSENWANQRARLIDLLRSQEQIMGMELFKHPLAGKLNLYQMLDFFSLHTARHAKQIEKTVVMISW
jgi:hypothetical protein